MKKKFIILILTFIVISIFSYVYAEDVNNIEIEIISSKQEVRAGEDFIIKVNGRNLEKIGEGINAYFCKMNFNSNELELVEIQSVSEWGTPIYNKTKIDTGELKITATASQFINKSDNLFIVKFKVKDNIDYKVNNIIKITEFEAAKRDNGKIEKVISDNKSIKISINSQLSESENDNFYNNNNLNFVARVICIISVSILIVITILTVVYIKYKKKGKK